MASVSVIPSGYNTITYKDQNGNLASWNALYNGVTWVTDTSLVKYQSFHDYLYQNAIAEIVTTNQSVIYTRLDSGFKNYSTKLASIDARIANMQPAVITQSISFLIGAFVAIAFVIAVSRRFGR